MARGKAPKGRAQVQPCKPYNHVKTGGAVGDDAMEKGQRFMEQGSGVSDAVKDVGAEPNEGVGLPDPLEGHTR